MNNKLKEYLNKNKPHNKENISAILFSKETLTYYYVFNVDIKNDRCTVMCEPINKERPYCELYNILFDEIGALIGEYDIVKGESLNMSYKKVLKRLKGEEERLLSLYQY